MPTPRLTRLALTLALSTLWAPTVLLGQAPEPEAAGAPSDVRVFGSFGVGVGSEGGAGLMSLSVRTQSGDFIVRTASTFNVDLFGPSREVADLALMYGRLHEGGSGWLRLAAGPSYVDSRRDGEIESCAFFFCSYEDDRSQGFGVAVQVEGALRPRRTLGIGVSGFANLGAHSFGGATVTLHIGRVSFWPGSD